MQDADGSQQRVKIRATQHKMWESSKSCTNENKYISPVDVGPSVQDICDSLRRGMVEIVVRGEDVSVGVTIAGDVCARQPPMSLSIPVRMTQCMFSLTSIEPPLLACHRIKEPVVCADRNNHHHSLAANSTNA
jgi:hypothetical protein